MQVAKMGEEPVGAVRRRAGWSPRSGQAREVESRRPDLAADVSHALALSRATSGHPIFVSEREGSVRLEGMVDACWRKEAAAEIARDVPGVREVRNAVTVEPRPAVPDDALAESIVSTVRKHGPLRAELVHLEVMRGVVTLGGTVSTPYEKHLLEDVAKHTVGVVHVDSRIAVRLGAAPRSWGAPPW